MSTQNDGTADFHFHIIQECQMAGYPCIPDITDPIVAVRYIALKWLGLKSRNGQDDYVERAKQLDLIVTTIRKHPCMAISRVRKLIEDA